MLEPRRSTSAEAEVPGVAMIRRAAGLPNHSPPPHCRGLSAGLRCEIELRKKKQSARAGDLRHSHPCRAQGLASKSCENGRCASRRRPRSATRGAAARASLAAGPVDIKLPRGRNLQAEQNTVIHEAPCSNRAAALQQKPRRLAQQRSGAPRAFPTTRHLLIVEASAQASAVKSNRERSHLRGPATSTTRIHAARKDSH